MIEYHSHSPLDTISIAADFGKKLAAGDFVALTGELGAGKTEFVRGIVQARLGEAGVSSPSFVRVHSYGGTPPIFHLDFYLAKSEEDALDYGIDELLASGSIVLAEWADIFPRLTPNEAVRVLIELGEDEMDRIIRID